MPVVPTIARDIAGLIARIAVAAVLIAHGWQKFSEYTIAGTTASFEQMGVPAPALSAWIAAIVELGGGILLLIGLLQAVAGVLSALVMAGAIFFVHLPNGLFADAGGYELPLVIGALALMIAAFGSGRFSLDYMLFDRKRAVAVA